MIFVTGGKGFIGSNFVRSFLAQGNKEDILILDNDSYASKQENIIDLLNGYTDEGGDYHASSVDAVTIDIANEAAMMKLFLTHKPKFVINFAAHTHVDRSIDNDQEFLRTNAEGVRVILKCVNALNTLEKRKEKAYEPHCQLLHISTDEVYGENLSDRPTTIHDAYAPSNPYAAAKAAGDMFCEAYRRTYGTPVFIAHLTNVYGPRQHDEKFIPTLIRAYQKNEPAPLYGLGDQSRQWLYIDDCCSMLIELANWIRKGDFLDKPEFRTFIAGNGAPIVSNLGVAIKVARFVGLENVPVKFVADRPGHDRRYHLASNMWPRNGYTNFNEGLKRTIEWYKNH